MKSPWAKPTAQGRAGQAVLEDDSFIRGIVDECGHHLIEGAESEAAGRDGAIERDIGLALVCDQIKTWKTQGENEGAGDEDGNDEEEDDIYV
jgi:hypothetical protein